MGLRCAFPRTDLNVSDHENGLELTETDPLVCSYPVCCRFHANSGTFD